jgi:hypothetical protein
MPEVMAHFCAELCGDGLDRAWLRAALDDGNSGCENNAERLVNVGAPRVRLGCARRNGGIKCRDQAAPGRKADGREPLGGDA